MSKQELDRYHVISRLIHKGINGPQASALLRLSTRQVRRLKGRVQVFGAKGLPHRSRGRKSNNSIPDKERRMMADVLKRHYADFGPTLACEKLTEAHGITRDVKTIRQIMIEEGLWKPHVRKRQVHRAWRQRRPCFGEMQQFDGSYEHWFEERAPKCCLLAAIDDATGKITHARFGEDEGVREVFTFWLGYIERFGRPRSIYMDKFSTYKMNPRFAAANHELKTQFERALAELGITTLTAHSPEAKGRIERLFGTLQDRLIKEMRLAYISTIKEANLFLENAFIPEFNRKFAVPAQSPANLHQSLTLKECALLPAVFSKHYARCVQNDFTISFNNHWYQLTDDQPLTVCKQDRVTVEERVDGAVHIRLRGKYLNYVLIPKRTPKRKQPWVLAAVAHPAKADILTSL